MAQVAPHRSFESLLARGMVVSILVSGAPRRTEYRGDNYRKGRRRICSSSQARLDLDAGVNRQVRLLSHIETAVPTHYV